MARECLSLADALAAGLADVCVLLKMVEGCGGEGRGHQLAEPGRVQVDEIPTERLLRLRRRAGRGPQPRPENRWQADVITDCEVGG